VIYEYVADVMSLQIHSTSEEIGNKKYKIVAIEIFVEFMFIPVRNCKNVI